MNEEKQHLTGISLLLGAISISMATFLIVLDYSIANVSIPYISGDLAASVDEGTYVITSFAVGNAIVLPLCGWLAKRFGMIRLLVFSILSFTFLSWVCGTSTSLVMLVIARFLQGAVAGPMIPISQALILLIFPKDRQASALGFWSSIIIVAPIVGPILGGWLSYDYSWPWIFYINIPFGIFSALTIKFVLNKYETPPQKLSLDWIGLMLLAVFVTCFQFTLDKGEQYDWLDSITIRICAVVALICFSFLIVWELFHQTPVLELRLLRVRSFALSLIFIAISYSLYFGTVVLIPLWLQTYMGYTSVWAGIAVAPLGLIPALFSTWVGKLVNRIGSLIPLAICFTMYAISSFATAYLNTDVDIWHIIFS